AAVRRVGAVGALWRRLEAAVGGRKEAGVRRPDAEELLQAEREARACGEDIDRRPLVELAAIVQLDLAQVAVHDARQTGPQLDGDARLYEDVRTPRRLSDEIVARPFAEEIQYRGRRPPMRRRKLQRPARRTEAAH